MTMVSPAANDSGLFRTRNRSVAKSFYRELRTQGFSHAQIIDLSTTLLDLVTQELKQPPTAS